MRHFSLALLLLALCCSVGFAQEKERDLSGAYTASGVGVNGAKYEATATLTLKGDTYLIQWRFGDGGFSGVGIRDGDVLSVGWSNGGKAGVVLYKISGNTLEGRWADGSSNGKVYTETLTRN